jgi:hypothetical protein
VGDTNTHIRLRAGDGTGVVAWSERNTSHDVSGPVIGKSGSPAPGVSAATHPGVQPATHRPPVLCNPLRWVCAHQIITSVRVVCLGGRRAIWQPPQLISQYRARAPRRYCSALVGLLSAAFCFFSALALFLFCFRSDIWTEWLRERGLMRCLL